MKAIKIKNYIEDKNKEKVQVSARITKELRDDLEKKMKREGIVKTQDVIEALIRWYVEDGK